MNDALSAPASKTEPAATDYAVAPGEYLAEWMGEQGFSKKHVATLLGYGLTWFNAILDGRAPLTKDTADRLARVVGIPADSWLRYEALYRADLVRITTPVQEEDPEIVDVTPEHEETWVDRYKRRVLDFVGAIGDVDLETVKIISAFHEGYSYSEHTGESAHFAIEVTWAEKAPRPQAQGAPFAPGPNADGLYPRRSVLENEDVARFLDSLESPE